MKKNQLPFYPETSLICTDGSTVKNVFPYSKTDLFLNPDIKSNGLWLPINTDVELDDFSKKSSKFKKYEFDFGSLVKK